MRALVRRPRRKMHLAHHDGVQWVALCRDHVIPDDHATTCTFLECSGGATTQLVDAMWATIADDPHGLCAHCRVLVLYTEVLRADRLYPRRELEQTDTRQAVTA